MGQYQKKNPVELISYFIKLYPFRFLTVLILLIIAGIFEVVGVGALLPLLNLVLETDNAESNQLTILLSNVFQFAGIEQSFKNLLIFVVVAITIKCLIVFWALRSVSFTAIEITYDLRQRFINLLMSAKWPYYSSLDIGKSTNAIATETDYAGQYCVIVAKTIAVAIQAAIYTLIAFTIDWKITVVAIIMGGLAAFIFKIFVRMTRDAGNDMAAALNRLTSRLQGSLSGAKPIKAMGEESRYVHFLTKDTLELQETRKRLSVAGLALQYIHEPVMVLMMAFGLYWAYVTTAFPMSELFMMAFLFNRLLSQINLIQNHYQKTAIFEGAVNEILQKITEAESEKEFMQGQNSPVFSEEIQFQDLELAYNEKAILTNFNDKIPLGKMTVLFGPSGVGKSTLLDSMLGLMPIKSGTIEIDGMSLSDVDIKQWRKLIGYVPQETFLFHDSIRENITLGDKDISEQQILEALKNANASEFIMQLEDGLDHIVGERGGKLSGGQRQRIALARALVREPQILILDEATSGLDENNEKEIMATLKAMLPAVTVILISHDPNVLKIADHVIDFQNHSE